MRSPYLNLDPARREIRLLKVHPRKSYLEHVEANPQWIPNLRREGSDGQLLLLDDQTVTNLINSYQEFGISDPRTPLIACELVDKVMLSRANASYCALSYCAGKPAETAVILVDGLPFDAFANLEHAIGCALECWTSRNPGKELVLWVDQICINQCDPVEKGRQIGMMRDIYHRSIETFVCLSTTSVDDCLFWVPRDPRPISEHQFVTENALVTEEEPRTVTILKQTFQELLLGEDDEELSSTLPELASSGGQSVPPPPSTSVQPQPQSGNLFQNRLPSPSSRWRDLPFAETLPLDSEFNPSSYRALSRRPLGRSYAETLPLGSRPGPSSYRAPSRRPLDRSYAETPLLDSLSTQFIIPSRAQPVRRDEALLESIRAFMECPWWRRSWVYQEFIISPRPCFLSGSTSISWMELHPVLEFVCSGLDNFLDSMIAFAATKAEQEDGRIRLEAVKKQELTNAQYGAQREAGLSKQQAIDKYNAKLANSADAIISKKVTTNPLNFPLRLILEYKMKRIQDKEINSRRDISKWIDEAQKDMHKRIGSYRALPQDPLIEDIVRWDKVVRSLNYKDGGIPRQRGRTAQHDLETLLPPNKWKTKKKHIEALQIRLRDSDSSVAFSMMKDKTKIQRTSDLKELLQHSRSCEASDPRDRVYAFLGLAHRGYEIELDYTMQNTIIQVLIITTSRIIEYDKSLKVLEHVYQGRNELGHSLPTWVPDWTSKESDQGFKKDDLVWVPGQEARPFDASKGLPTQAEFRKDNSNESAVDMKVKGVFVDILGKCEGAAESFPGLQSFLMPYSGRTLRVISPKTGSVGGQVWVLHGMSQPAVLEHIFHDTYSFLGEVLVCELGGSFSEIMFGQMIQMAEQGGAESREIWLT